MHIPDGYLSPETIVVTYAAAIPFWRVAGRRLRARLNFGGSSLAMAGAASAFMFVVQMFNVPVLGGTTGHALGSAGIAIVFGPWFAVAATSVTLLVQALMFGDGGITAFAANVLIMAVIAPFVGYWTYKRLSGRFRSVAGRLVTAGLAGYVGINAAALSTALLLGAQFYFFRAGGRPLYAPFPLTLAVPGIMAGHLFVFGPLEGFVSIAVVALAGQEGWQEFGSAAGDGDDV